MAAMKEPCKAEGKESPRDEQSHSLKFLKTAERMKERKTGSRKTSRK